MVAQFTSEWSLSCMVIFIYHLLHVIFRYQALPFLCETLKSWEWPGDEAMVLRGSTSKYVSKGMYSSIWLINVSYILVVSVTTSQ